MPSATVVWLVAQLEWRAALRNWWLLLYAALFVVLVAAITFLSTTELSTLERGEFGRTAAAITNVVMVLIPLFALIAGSAAVAPERERGRLGYVLSHPITTGEVLAGKFLGGVCALTLVLVLGLAAGALGLARSGALELAGFLWLSALAWLLTVASFSVGMLVSTLARRSQVAVGMGIFLWVSLLFLSDLGLMATATMTGVDLRLVVVLTVLNPAEAFKVAAVDRVDTSLDVLGPGGQWLADTLGDGLMPLMLLVLLVWAVVPTALAALRLGRSDVG